MYYKEYRKENIMNRASGILLHISSLPNKYGIGSFGEEVIKFCDFLKDMGIKYWQTLPFGTIDNFGSPYKSFSAFAGNPLFINLPKLYEKGLITKEELKENEYNDPYIVNFKWLNEKRMEILKKAYLRIDNEYKKEILKFSKLHKNWLYDFSLYMTIREKNNNKDWYQWEDEKLKFHDKDAIKKFREENLSEVLFYEFLQYEFYTQWEEIKKQINEKGIKIIGDVPIYVSYESSDVWGNPHIFDLTEDGSPRFISGVPPDYFSEDGQKWGNPLYNWKSIKKGRYSWWIKRLEHSLSIFDIIRIDHFRGFSAYWAIPAESETAKDGNWVDGPGLDFFNAILKKIDKNCIIAEDLGDIDEKTRTLLEETGFPGMRVIQFGFSGDNSIHLPHNYDKNVIAYSGTHDNNTILGWLWEATPEERNFALDYCDFKSGENWKFGGFYSESCRAIIKTLWKSSANIVILPIQDLCGFGADTRMNKPGRAQGNWFYRITEEQLNNIDKEFIKNLNKLFYR
nr:4-alpha-glucanotransferase [Fusobacterium perfoetens]